MGRFDFSSWYTTLVLRTGLGHSWTRTVGWFLAHSIITGSFIFFAGLGENIIYDAWTYVWFGAWICLVFIIRRTTNGLAETLGVPLTDSHFYTSDIYKFAKKQGNNVIGNDDFSKSANAFLHQPAELILGVIAYILFAYGFIPWSYQGGLYGLTPYPWFDLVLYANLIFFFFDYLLFSSVIFVVLGLLYPLLRVDLGCETELDKLKGEIENMGIESPVEKNVILFFPIRIRRIGHSIADVTLGAFGLVLLLEVYWLVSNTMKGLEFSWSGLVLLIPLFFGTLIAFILAQKKLHDTLSPYWEDIKLNYPTLLTAEYGVLSQKDIATTVLENSRRYKFGILLIFILGCTLIDYHLFQLIGLEIWTAVGIQIAVMAGLMQGWQFVE